MMKLSKRVTEDANELQRLMEDAEKELMVDRASLRRSGVQIPPPPPQTSGMNARCTPPREDARTVIEFKKLKRIVNDNTPTKLVNKWRSIVRGGSTTPELEMNCEVEVEDGELEDEEREEVPLVKRPKRKRRANENWCDVVTRDVYVTPLIPRIAAILKRVEEEEMEKERERNFRDAVMWMSRRISNLVYRIDCFDNGVKFLAPKLRTMTMLVSHPLPPTHQLEKMVAEMVETKRRHFVGCVRYLLPSLTLMLKRLERAEFDRCVEGMVGKIRCLLWSFKLTKSVEAPPTLMDFCFGDEFPEWGDVEGEGEEKEMDPKTKIRAWARDLSNRCPLASRDAYYRMADEDFSDWLEKHHEAFEDAYSNYWPRGF